MKVAITGTIGSGKTFVSDYLRSKDLFVFDCDKYNAYLLEKNNDVLNKILESFPNSVNHLCIDKKALANEVFSNEDKRKKLESIMHPYIINKINEEADQRDLFIAEVPLLFEAGLESFFDVIILIVANEKLLHLRLNEKGYSDEDIKRRMSSQLPIEIKMKRATEIIYNNGSFLDLYNEIDKLICKYDWE